MDCNWSERTFVVLAELVPGSNPTKGQLKKLVKVFDIKWDGLKEKDMYPILVRNQFILTAARLSSNNSSDSVLHSTPFHLLLRQMLASNMSRTGARTTSSTCDRIWSCIPKLHELV